ncbi:hypothetical protein HMPREF0201_04323 [Cedecea davisae DSM 4568]|uniref:Uncharacterized protein n=1 Tax=Cedecea davisae DSM 4568 TaxID=566551 RepID=S3IJA8_9ENTR|nr:hypothetical protein HMPREF0201_04323 [Cedecea davisae DSM 4568]
MQIKYAFIYPLIGIWLILMGFCKLWNWLVFRQIKQDAAVKRCML